MTMIMNYAVDDCVGHTENL